MIDPLLIQRIFYDLAMAKSSDRIYSPDGNRIGERGAHYFLKGEHIKQKIVSPIEDVPQVYKDKLSKLQEHVTQSVRCAKNLLEERERQLQEAEMFHREILKGDDSMIAIPPEASPEVREKIQHLVLRMGGKEHAAGQMYSYSSRHPDYDGDKESELVSYAVRNGISINRPVPLDHFQTLRDQAETAHHKLIKDLKRVNKGQNPVHQYIIPKHAFITNELTDRNVYVPDQEEWKHKGAIAGTHQVINKEGVAYSVDRVAISGGVPRKINITALTDIKASARASLQGELKRAQKEMESEFLEPDHQERGIDGVDMADAALDSFHEKMQKLRNGEVRPTKNRLFIARNSDGSLAGLCHAEYTPNSKEVYVHFLGATHLFGGGIGTSLLHEVHDWGKQLGAHKTGLTPLEDAVIFYEKNGFKPKPNSHAMQYDLNQWKGSNALDEDQIEYPDKTYNPNNYDRAINRYKSYK